MAKHNGPAQLTAYSAFRPLGVGGSARFAIANIPTTSSVCVHAHMTGMIHVGSGNNLSKSWHLGERGELAGWSKTQQRCLGALRNLDTGPGSGQSHLSFGLSLKALFPVRVPANSTALADSTALQIGSRIVSSSDKTNFCCLVEL